MLRRAFIVSSCAAAVLAAAASPAAAGLAVPDDYRVESRRVLADGLEHLTLVGNDPRRVVNVASLSRSAPFSLRSVVSDDAVSGGSAERTSAMCVRYACRVAVNADFSVPDSGEPIGGVVSFGQLLRSPVDSHHQLVASADGDLRAGLLGWNASLVSTDLRRLDIQGVNVPRETGRLVLYTAAHGASTGTNQHGVEVVAEVVRPAPSIRIGETSIVRLLELHDGTGDVPIPRHGAVLSGHGSAAEALLALWARVESQSAAPEVLLRIETDPEAAESVGGSPILVRDGRRWFADDDTDFVRGRHPRTMVGWDAAGNVLLVSVDGRQSGYSEGMTLAEATDLLLRLGAVEAINLDGGGSTTFVVDGGVVNRPSDRAVRRDGRRLIAPLPRRGDEVLGFVERPVSTALLIVLRSSGTVEPLRTLGPADLHLPQALPLPVPQSIDPASDPASGLPALVATAEGDGRVPRPVPLAAGALAAAGAAVLVERRFFRSAAA